MLKLSTEFDPFLDSEIDNDALTDIFENVPDEGNDSIFDDINVNYNKGILKLRRKENLSLNPPKGR